MTRTAQLIDEAVTAAFDESAFLTGQIAELDLGSGGLRWINAGHPAPLLIRDGRVVSALHADPMLPLGLGGLDGASEPEPDVGSVRLQTGDLVLFYSDGVVETRSPDGEFFGTDRLVELIALHLASGLPAPETLRRVIRSLLDHQQGQLDDDASLFLVHYRPTDVETLLVPHPDRGPRG